MCSSELSSDKLPASSHKVSKCYRGPTRSTSDGRIERSPPASLLLRRCASMYPRALGQVPALWVRQGTGRGTMRVRWERGATGFPHRTVAVVAVASELLFPNGGRGSITRSTSSFTHPLAIPPPPTTYRLLLPPPPPPSSPAPRPPLSVLEAPSLPFLVVRETVRSSLPSPPPPLMPYVGVSVPPFSLPPSPVHGGKRILLLRSKGKQTKRETRSGIGTAAQLTRTLLHCEEPHHANQLPVRVRLRLDLKVDHRLPYPQSPEAAVGVFLVCAAGVLAAAGKRDSNLCRKSSVRCEKEFGVRGWLPALR